MPWRWSNPDARPISEYLYNFHESRKRNKFLYYCRDCIRNFDTPERVEKCPKCRHDSIIELPKQTKLKSARGRKPGLAAFRRDVAITGNALSNAVKSTRFALWRTKIALYYVLTSMPEELK